MSEKTKNLLEPIIIYRLNVGKYDVTRQGDGSYWIRHNSGEGLRTTPEKLEKLIHDFYCDES